MSSYAVSEDTQMEQILKESAEFSLPTAGSTVTGTIITKTKSQILVDINGVTVGVIAGRELNDSFNTAKDLKEGDTVEAVVLEDENEDGMMILSIRKAGQFNTWERFEKAIKTKQVVSVVPNEANKGGLLVYIDGIKAFIPVSQLSPEHYPRVENSDSNKILLKLKSLIGKTLKVCVINLDRNTGKMILSEKEARKGDQDESLKDLAPGSEIEGKITGISKFGFFVTFGELEGLVHISEIAWGHVSDPSDYGKVGDTIKVKVIGIEGNKISLSLKRMTEDPWITLTQKFKVGDIVKGTINKVSEFGAFVSLDEDVNGLIHLSEIEDGAKDAREYFKNGEEIEAKIIEINSEEHRIALSVKGIMKFNKKKPTKKEKEQAKEEKVEKTEEKPEEES